MSVLKEWLARAAGIFRRRPSDVGAELAFHREMTEERLRRQGHSPTEAHRLAAIEVGGAAQMAEAYDDQRGVPAIESLVQDIRYGLRMLRRTPGFTAAAVLTLAVGIGANTAIFSVVDAVLLRPLPYPDPERLVAVGDRRPDGVPSSTSFTTAMDWKARSRSFERLVLMRSWQPTLVVNGEAERLPAVRVGWDYFDMMGVRPALGRTFREEEDRPDQWRVLMLSDALWRRRFNADPSVIGRTVVMNDREYRVIGVMPPSFEPLDAERFYNASAELWAPVGYDLAYRDACRGCQHLRAFGRLKPGVSIADATSEMNAVREQMRREFPNAYEAGTVAVMPLRDAITGTVRPALQVLLGAVGFVLLIACANVANLLLARSVTRRREIVLRSILGAGRGRIVRQLLTESALLSGFGAVLGVGLAMVAMDGLAALAPVSLPRIEGIAVDGRVLAFTAMITILTSAVFGFLPAWRSADAGMQRSLSIDNRSSIGGMSRTRSALVIADLALAVVLLAGAGLMLRTVAALTHASPGFTSSGVLTMHFSLVGRAYAEDPAVVAFQERFLAAAKAVPGVESVALAGQIPFGGNGDCWGFHAQGRMKANTVDDPCVERYGTSPEYLRVMGTPLRAGRFFTESDVTSSQPVIVISESTARTIWGTDSPLGAQVRLGLADTGPWRTVVGVVADVHHEDVTAPVAPAMYTPQSQVADSFLVAVVKTPLTDPAALVGPLRDVLRSLDPAVPVYDVATLDALVAKASGQQTFVMRLLGAFAAVAVFLAALGLYGVVSYGVSQRTREVGVRVALGAQRRDVMRLVLSDGMWLVAAGITLGLVAAAAVTRYLGALTFGVSPVDVPTFSATAALLVGVALLAHWLPTRRALRVDPSLALRQD
jgi:putative ABC transport system permease protein